MSSGSNDIPARTSASSPEGANSPTSVYRSWEYAKQGDYHRNIDPSWAYAPTYFRKMAYIDSLIAPLPAETRIVDIGCGEGVLVEKYIAQGRRIEGLDLNYRSPLVRQGNILEMPYPEGSFDAALALDVIEHLQFNKQLQALREVHRILTPGGLFIAAIPNLAHLNSRIRLLLKGELDRCDLENDHPGERPMAENRDLLFEAGFKIERIKGITLSVPWLYRRVICRHAVRLRWLHDALDRIAAPALAMLDVFVCRRE